MTAWRYEFYILVLTLPLTRSLSSLFLQRHYMYISSMYIYSTKNIHIVIDILKIYHLILNRIGTV